MADILTLKKFEALSPFEIKDELINLAKATSRTSQSAFLNAGRGNPNWVATTPREGFFLLGQFAVTESKRVMEHPAGVGGMPQAFRRIALGRRAASPENGFIDTRFWRTIMIFTPVILIHLATAIASVVVGGAMFLMKKGTPQHRLSGRVWVVLMAVTALVSFAIQTRGHFT